MNTTDEFIVIEDELGTRKIPNIWFIPTESQSQEASPLGDRVVTALTGLDIAFATIFPPELHRKHMLKIADSLTESCDSK